MDYIMGVVMMAHQMTVFKYVVHLVNLLKIIEVNTLKDIKAMLKKLIMDMSLHPYMNISIMMIKKDIIQGRIREDKNV